MTKDEALSIVKKFINTIQENQIDKLSQILDPDCEIEFKRDTEVIISGIEKIKERLMFRIQQNFKVHHYDILSFYFENNVAICDWECEFDFYEKKNYKNMGVTFYYFKNNKIYKLKEYSQEKPTQNRNSDIINYNIEQLLDGKKIQKILQYCNDVIGTHIALLDLKGSIVVQPINKIICGDIFKSCCNSNCELLKKDFLQKILDKQEEFSGVCSNDFAYAFMPLFLNGTKCGFILRRQFFWEEYQKEKKVDQFKNIGQLIKIPVLDKNECKKNNEFIKYGINIVLNFGYLKIKYKEKYNEKIIENQAKTEFFANISHELRTPVNVILSALKVLQKEYKDTLVIDNMKTEEYNYKKNKYEKYFSMLHQNSYRLIRLINNLIDISKIEAEYYKLNLENTNIVHIIEEITLSVAEYIKNKGIQLIFDTDVEEKIIACDPNRIERIILNLLSNAVKFIEPPGKIFVKIFDYENKIKVMVEDTGIGIPKDKQKKIFDRFEQVDKTLTKNHEGSGIGLALVKSLIQMHGGEIWIESEENNGTKFFFEIPSKTICSSKESKPINNAVIDNRIEKINIEFSDIYL